MQAVSEPSECQLMEVVTVRIADMTTAIRILNCISETAGYWTGLIKLQKNSKVSAGHPSSDNY